MRGIDYVNVFFFMSMSRKGVLSRLVMMLIGSFVGLKIVWENVLVYIRKIVVVIVEEMIRWWWLCLMKECMRWGIINLMKLILFEIVMVIVILVEMGMRSRMWIIVGLIFIVVVVELLEVRVLSYGV